MPPLRYDWLCLTVIEYKRTKNKEAIKSCLLCLCEFESQSE